MDIATVQMHFARLGKLSRIDLRLAEGVAPATPRASACRRCCRPAW